MKTAKTIDPSMTDVRHSFSRVVAYEYGINAALVFGYFSYRICKSKHKIEGRTWYYETVDNIVKVFPYLTRAAVYAAIRKLTGEEGLLVTGCFNKKAYDRTTWYAFKTAKSYKLATLKPIYFKIEDAYWYDIAKAILISNLDYWIQENQKTQPLYQLHPMSPTELAKVLPFSSATIKRKLKELVEKDDVLVSVTQIDGREPAKYGFKGEVHLELSYDINPPRKRKIPGKQPLQPAQNRMEQSEGQNIKLEGASPNAGGSNQNNYTILVDNCLEDSVERVC